MNSLREESSGPFFISKRRSAAFALFDSQLLCVGFTDAKKRECRSPGADPGRGTPRECSRRRANIIDGVLRETKVRIRSF